MPKGKDLKKSDFMNKIVRFFGSKLIIIKNNLFNNCNISINCYSNLKSQLEGKNVIKKNTDIGNTYIGYASYIGENCSLYNSKIGKYCSLSSNIVVVRGNHPTNTFVSTHPAFYSTARQSGFTYVDYDKFDEFKILDNGYSIEIGNDVWIGTNVIIMEGVTIGDGAIIGAGAVVTKNIEPYSINVGVPAHKIKSRFTDEQINFLLQEKWWKRDESWIRRNSYLFSNINDLMKVVVKNEK